MSEITRARLREDLFGIGTASAGDDAVRTSELRSAFVDFGSETDDNRAATNRLEVGPLDGGDAGRTYLGMRLAGTRVGISAVVHAAEGCPVPEQVRQNLPGLTQEDWDVAMRLTCLVLLSLERRDAG